MAANPRPVPTLEMSAKSTAAETTVRCRGVIVTETCQSLRTLVKPLLSNNGTVVLDLIDVNYMDSLGLGTIVSLYISAKAARCQLRLVNLNQRVKELFRITRLGEVDSLLVPDLWKD